LLFGNSNPHNLHPVAFGQVLGCAAPATADVEHAHAGLQIQLAGNEIQLGFLGLVQGLRPPIPIGTAIDQAAIQHGLVEVVAEVVVALANHKCPLAPLAVDKVTVQSH
jgi:hypothetical protein